MVLDLIVDPTEHFMEEVAPGVVAEVAAVPDLHLAPVLCVVVIIRHYLPCVVIRKDAACVAEVDTDEE